MQRRHALVGASVPPGHEVGDEDGSALDGRHRPLGRAPLRRVAPGLEELEDLRVAFDCFEGSLLREHPHDPAGPVTPIDKRNTLSISVTRSISVP